MEKRRSDKQGGGKPMRDVGDNFFIQGKKEVKKC